MQFEKRYPISDFSFSVSNDKNMTKCDNKTFHKPNLKLEYLEQLTYQHYHEIK